MGKGHNMKRQTTAALKAILVLSAISVGVCGGCNACGTPAFVKLSPEGRFVVYQDQIYPTTYVYDVDRECKTIFNGRVSCMNKDVSRLVLRDKPDQDYQTKCRLIVLDQNGPTASELPPLPTPSNCYFACFMFIDNGPDILGLLYETHRTGESARAVRLTHNSRKWEDVSVPKEYCRSSHWKTLEPMGDRLSGHLYSTKVLPILDHGLDVEQVDGANYTYHYILKSPRGDYTVTIRDPSDIWNRVWLTKADGTRVLLLDKNDIPDRIKDYAASVPVSLFLILTGTRL